MVMTDDSWYEEMTGERTLLGDGELAPLDGAETSGRCRAFDTVPLHQQAPLVADMS